MHTADGVCSFSKDIVKCIHTDYFAYESFEMEQTVATDNNLVCADDYCVPLIDTFMIMGFLIGSFVFGIMSDKNGRTYFSYHIGLHDRW